MWNRSVHNLWINLRLRAHMAIFHGSALDIVVRNHRYTLRHIKSAIGRQLVHILPTGL